MKKYSIFGKLKPHVKTAAILVIFDCLIIGFVIFLNPYVVRPEFDDLVDASIEKNDLSLCRLAKSSAGCVYEVAKEQRNSDVCFQAKDLIKDFSVSECLIELTYAISGEEGEELCKKAEELLNEEANLSDEMKKKKIGDCYSNAGPLVSNCQFITQPDTRLWCQLYKQEIPRTVKSCRDFIDLHSEDDCIKKVAVTTLNPTICNELLENDKYRCVLQVVRESHDPSFCNLIPNPPPSFTSKEDCLRTIDQNSDPNSKW